MAQTYAACEVPIPWPKLMQQTHCPLPTQPVYEPTARIISNCSKPLAALTSTRRLPAAAGAQSGAAPDLDAGTKTGPARPCASMLNWLNTAGHG